MLPVGVELCADVHPFGPGEGPFSCLIHCELIIYGRYVGNLLP